MKRKVLIIAALLIVTALGAITIDAAAAKKEELPPEDCVNPKVKLELLKAVDTNDGIIKTAGIVQAKEKIKAELERLEAERREAERLEAQKLGLKYKRVVYNPASSAPGEKYIALTFDDGPGPHTDRLLNILNTYGAKSTFFVVGKSIDRNPGVLNRMINEGHEIGGHSWNHSQLTTLGEAEVAAQLLDTRNKIGSVTGTDTILVRPPYGSVDSATKTVGANVGCSFINWSVDSLDWKTRDVDAIYCDIMSTVKNGSIILCHDIHGTTVDAMEYVVPDLIAQGYHLVTVTQLLGATTPGVVYYSG